MAPRSCITSQSPRIKTPVNLVGELDELADAQSPARKSNAESNEAFTMALTPPETLTLPFVPSILEDLFTKFMKMFIKTTQARDWEQLELQKRPFKARTPETYSGKSHIDYNYICQQYEDYFKTSGATRMNHTLFVAIFFHDSISLR